MVSFSFLSSLQKELVSWKERGIISAKQEKEIAEFYKEKGMSLSLGDHRNRFAQIVTIIGSILIGIGIILYFAANWDTMSDLLKTIIIFASIISTYMAGWILYYQRNYQKTGYAFVLLASILYGAGIFLLGQIYNLGGTFYDAMLLWFIGVLPVAYVTGFGAVFTLALILFYGYVFGYIEENFRFVGQGVVALYIGFLSLFILVYSSFHKKKYENFAFLGGVFGLLLTFLSAFLLTFHDFYSGGYEGDEKVLFIAFGIGFLVLILTFVNFFRRDKKVFEWEDYGFLFHLILLAGFVTFFFLQISQKSLVEYNQAVEIGMNVYFLGMIIAVIYAALRRGREYPINIALIFFIIFMIAKYFDWFYDMMDRALFFIFGGVIIVFGGWILEKKRKQLLEKIETSHS